MAERYFLSEHSGHTPQHGGIGNHDIDVILEREGFRPIIFPSTASFGPLAKIQRLFFLLKLWLTMPADAVIAFQYPVDATLAELAIGALNNGRRTIICIVTDIDGIKDGDEGQLKKDLKRLARFRHFIVHTPAMRDWFLDQGIKGRFSCLDYFDYLTPLAPMPRKRSNEVIYAGNLENRPFVNRLHELGTTCPQVRFHVYGPGGSSGMGQQVNLSFHGSMDAHQLPSSLVGSYGLIWEGDSLSSLHGGYARYLKYIAPHKLSMYIAAGIPVICHPEMGIADQVTRQGIGLKISDLNELEKVLEGVSDEGYATMRSHCLRLRPRITEGRCLAEAMTDLLAETNS